ncbi:cytochrome P450 [Fomes fomentarius]|nr:cytochrome P450 [Fomes fomentarius]
MNTLFSLFQATIIGAVTWFLWKYFRQIVVTSPLDNVPGPPSGSFLYGNLRQVLHKSGWGFIQHLTDTYPGVVKLRGPFGHRMLYIFDPVALHHVVVKDQHIFEEPHWLTKFNMVRFGPGLLATLGDQHRKQRKMLNPVFSIAHMRNMVPIFHEIVRKLEKAIEDRVRSHDGTVEIDMLNWMGRTALELIGQTGLGYSFDPLVADHPDDFASAIKAMGPTMAKVNHLRRIMPYLPESGSIQTRRTIMGMVPHAGIRQMKAIIDTLHRRSSEIYAAKKRALEQGDQELAMQIGEGKDIMSILMRANMTASEGDRIPEEELIAQMSTFVFGAMDTTSNALSITFHLLAENPEVQGKLRAEILDASKEAFLDYDTLVSLPYLDAVCRETLRLHSPVTTTYREAHQDTILPLSQPIRGVDGKMMHEITVPTGTPIVVGILSANRNKAIWGADALEWKPERWLVGLPSTVTEAKIPGVYSNLMTFMGGGRACIGFKFSQLEMKIVLCVLLSKFTFALSDKKIVWNLSNIRYPTAGDNPKPSLPMKVEIYRGGATA